MARWLAVAGLVVALGAGLVFLLGDGLDADATDGDGIHDPAFSDGTDDPTAVTGVEDPETGRTPSGNSSSPDGDPDGPPRPTGDASRRTGLFGSVTDAQGNAVSGARIVATRRPRVLRRGTPTGTPLASTESDGTGLFLLGPLPKRGAFLLRATAPGFAATTVDAARRGTRADIVLHRGGVLRIEVVDTSGTAIPDATVTHVVGWHFEAITTQATTGADGIARFESVPTGSGEIVVTADGFGAVRLRNMAASPEEPLERTAVLERGQTAEGRVVDRSTLDPVKGARVRVYYPNLPMLPPGEAVTTEEDGSFAVPVAAQAGEAVEFRVEHSAYAEARVRRTFAVRDTFTVELQPRGEGIQGRVIDLQRKGAGGVPVTFLGLSEEDEVPKTVTRADGSFTLPLPGHQLGSVQVFAHDPTRGMALQYVNLGTKPTEGARRPIVLRLTGAGTVSGVVTGADGEPVESALVELTVDATGSREMVGPGVQPGHVQTALRLGEGVGLSAVTDAEGYYVIDGAPPLAYVATARLGRMEGRAEDLVVVDAYGPVSANIQITRGGTISGYVVDGDDRPLSGALVTANALRRLPGGTLRRPSVRSGPDGQFVLYGVDEGSWRLSVTAAGYGAKTLQDVASGDTDVTVRLVKLGWIQGVVEDAGGPLQGTFKIEVKQLRRDDGAVGVARTQFIGGSDVRTFSTDDGTFTIPGKEAGSYELRASTPGGGVSEVPVKVDVQNGQGSAQVRIRLARGARLHGKAVSESGRTPLTQAWINAVPRPGTESRGTQKGTRTDAKGAYTLEGLAAGEYLLRVYTSMGQNFSVPVTLRAGEDRELDLVWRTPGTVRVRVVDENGVAIEGARPILRSETGEIVQPNYQAMRADGLIGEDANWRSVAETNAEGVLVRHHVPPGSYRVSAAKSGLEPRSDGEAVVVYSGREATATVVLRPKSGD